MSLLSSDNELKSKAIIDLVGDDSEDELCVPPHLLSRVEAHRRRFAEEKMPPLERVSETATCECCGLKPELELNEDGECGLCSSRSSDIMNDAYGRNYLAYPKRWRIAVAEFDMEYFGFAWQKFNRHNY